VDKLLLHFTARSGAQAELEAALRERLEAGFRNLAGQGASATLLLALEKDPYRGTGEAQPARAFDASLEFKVEAADAKVEEQFRALLSGCGEELEGLVQRDLCAALVGTNKVFIACDATPLRFQYCMRRRRDFSEAQYLERYEKLHSAFGFKTKGIAGYVQFHIDAAASERAAQAAGFGVHAVNSVSELHIARLEDFFAAGADNATIGAGEDEDKFVDRANSRMWISKAALHLS